MSFLGVRFSYSRKGRQRETLSRISKKYEEKDYHFLFLHFFISKTTHVHIIAFETHFKLRTLIISIYNIDIYRDVTCIGPMSWLLQLVASSLCWHSPIIVLVLIWNSSSFYHFETLIKLIFGLIQINDY